MNWLVGVLCVLSGCVQGLDVELFKRKLQEPTPQWMEDQIQYDLAPFTRELSRRSIDELFTRDDLYLVRVRVTNGQLHIQKSSTAAGHPTPDQIVLHLYTLNELITLPDIDFLLTSHDTPMSLSPQHTFSQPSTPAETHIINHSDLIAPIFCITKYDNSNGFIVIPDMFALKGFEPSKTLVLEGNQIYPWESKVNLLFYRGSDIGIVNLSEWIAHRRPKLIALSTQYPHLIDAKFTSLYSPWRTHTKYAAKKKFMGNYVSLKDHGHYKYLISLDAVCASTPRFPLLLHSNSVIFKDATHSILWFFKALKPYEHFIPVAEDLSDLLMQIEWAKAHDKECNAISENARRLAAEVLTHEAVYLYLYRLLSAYSEKQSHYYLLDQSD